jgi:Rod binding domain-containing protein
MGSPINSLPQGSLDGGYSNISRGKHEDLATAAQQFEGLMLEQMLQSAHGSDQGWFSAGDGEEDKANNQAMEIAQQQFASALAAHGGLGLAKIIVSHLSSNPSTEGRK